MILVFIKVGGFQVRLALKIDNLRQTQLQAAVNFCLARQLNLNSINLYFYVEGSGGFDFGGITYLMKKG